jgi:hypothetical protein
MVAGIGQVNSRAQAGIQDFLPLLHFNGFADGFYGQLITHALISIICAAPDGID